MGIEVKLPYFLFFNQKSSSKIKGNGEHLFQESSISYFPSHSTCSKWWATHKIPKISSTPLTKYSFSFTQIIFNFCLILPLGCPYEVRLDNVQNIFYTKGIQAVQNIKGRWSSRVCLLSSICHVMRKSIPINASNGECYSLGNASDMPLLRKSWSTTFMFQCFFSKQSNKNSSQIFNKGSQLYVIL